MPDINFDNDTFVKDTLALREAKREAFVEAVAALETAAWAREWMGVKLARQRVEALIGVTITGPLDRELEAAQEAATALQR